MKVLSFLFCVALCVVVFFSVISFFRFAYVHIKAFIIRRKLAKLSETEEKDD